MGRKKGRPPLTTADNRVTIGVYAVDLQIDLVMARTARINPLERAMAWDGWVRIRNLHICPGCFERLRGEQSGEARPDFLSATMERAALRRIEVG